MLTKKLKILSEFKTPLPLFNAEKIMVLLPYEDGRTLEKNNVSIISEENGMIELTLSDFELQGLKVGRNNFLAKVFMKDGTLYTVNFANGCSIAVDDRTQRKVWL